MIRIGTVILGIAAVIAIAGIESGAASPTSGGAWEQGPVYKFISERDGGYVWISRREPVASTSPVIPLTGFTPLGRAMRMPMYEWELQPSNSFGQAVLYHHEEVAGVWAGIFARDLRSGRA